MAAITQLGSASSAIMGRRYGSFAGRNQTFPVSTLFPSSISMQATGPGTLNLQATSPGSKSLQSTNPGSTQIQV